MEEGKFKPTAEDCQRCSGWFNRRIDSLDLRPMASAPKDGTFIYLYGGSGYVTFPFRVVIGRWVKAYRDYWIDIEGDNFSDAGDARDPLFWSPIPKEHQQQYEAAVEKLGGVKNNGLQK
jgi:hypothetical protein